MTRITTFSAWRKPESFLIEDRDVKEQVRAARDEQIVIVLTRPDQDEPKDFNKAVDDRR